MVGGTGLPALEDGQLGSTVKAFALFSLYRVTLSVTTEARTDREAITIERPHIKLAPNVGPGRYAYASSSPQIALWVR